MYKFLRGDTTFINTRDKTKKSKQKDENFTIDGGVFMMDPVVPNNKSTDSTSDTASSAIDEMATANSDYGTNKNDSSNFTFTLF